jgi:hypothetical protein
MARKIPAIHEPDDVPVAVFSSRPSLDLAINVWVPGYVARSATDVDAVLDLTHERGVVVIDLGDADGPGRLELLHERGIDVPTVVVNVGDLELEEAIARRVVVADSTQVADLRSAFETARGRRVSRPAAAVAASTGASPRDGSVSAREDVGGPEELVPPEQPAATMAAPPPPPPLPSSATDPEPSGADDGAGVPTEQAVDGAGSEEAKAASAPSTAVPTLFAAGRPRRSAQSQGRSTAKGSRWWPFGGRKTTGPDRSDEEPTGEALTEQGNEATADGPGAEGGSPLFNEEAGEAANVIDLTEPLFERHGAGEERIIRLEPESDAKVSINPVVVGRSWVALDELEDVIGSGSAVVAVRATDASYAVVAALGVAPVEAGRLIGANHPLLREVRRAGWAKHLRSTDQGAVPPPPLADCDELLAIAVPRGGHDIDGVVLVGRFTPFSDDEVRSARALVGDTERLDERLRLLQTAGGDLQLAPPPDTGPFVPAALVHAGWGLLDDLFPLLGGAAAVVALEGDHTVFVPTAAVGVDAQVAARFIRADHPLLTHVRGHGGTAQVQAANEGYRLVGGLPLPTRPFVAAITVGPPDRDGAVVLLTRQRRFTPEELELLVSAIRESRFGELVRARRRRRLAKAPD